MPTMREIDWCCQHAECGYMAHREVLDVDKVHGGDKVLGRFCVGHAEELVTGTRMPRPIGKQRLLFGESR